PKMSTTEGLGLLGFSLKRFLACLRPDPAGLDGSGHRLRILPWARQEGTFFHGQSFSCHLCLGQGHTGRSCKTMKCQRCLEIDHLAKDCIGPHRCTQCGGGYHLSHSCPQRKPTYAGVVQCKSLIWVLGYFPCGYNTHVS
uniref:CCHC-type domain-containing protein n=1 Tax=Scleropages formosus TaxID=113540 RepID=A0A8C9RYT5_SCLFO